VLGGSGKKTQGGGEEKRRKYGIPWCGSSCEALCRLGRLVNGGGRARRGKGLKKGLGSRNVFTHFDRKKTMGWQAGGAKSGGGWDKQKKNRDAILFFGCVSEGSNKNGKDECQGTLQK